MAALYPTSTGRSQITVALLLMMLAVLTLGTACKKDAPPKAPAAKGARDAASDAAEPGDDDSSDGDADASEEEEEEEDEEEAGLAIAPESLAALKVPGTGAVSIKFTLSGADGKDVIVGLSEAPAGVALVKSGNTVTFGWATPLKGTHTLRFILRDREVCEAEEDDVGDCDIAPADYGKIGAKSYDVTSERFTLDVATGNGGVGGTGNGGGGNGDLIAQIIDLLGGGTDFKDLLSGLSTSQLTQILGLAQTGLPLDAIKGLLSL